MKKLLVILLVLALTACVAGPTKTPTALPTDVPAEEPTDVPAPTEEPTDEPAPTEAPEEEPTAEPASGNSFGDFEFTDKQTGDTRTGSAEFSAGAFAHDCDTLPDVLTLTVTANEEDIYKVNYVYRLTSATAGTISTGWSGDAKMEVLGDGKFKIDFPESQIPSEAVTWDAWFDVQFIAFDQQDITYSSPIFAKVIKYTYGCPE
jgi:hypothetical protein